MFVLTRCKFQLRHHRNMPETCVDLHLCLPKKRLTVYTKITLKEAVQGHINKNLSI